MVNMKKFNCVCKVFALCGFLLLMSCETSLDVDDYNREDVSNVTRGYDYGYEYNYDYTDSKGYIEWENFFFSKYFDQEHVGTEAVFLLTYTNDSSSLRNVASQYMNDTEALQMGWREDSRINMYKWYFMLSQVTSRCYLPVDLYFYSCASNSFMPASIIDYAVESLATPVFLMCLYNKDNLFARAVYRVNVVKRGVNSDKVELTIPDEDPIVATDEWRDYELHPYD